MKKGVSLGKYFEEIEIGEKWITPSRLITDAHILASAGLGGDFFHVHVDDEYARECGFKKRILHGLGTLQVVAGLQHETLPARGTMMAHLKTEVTYPAPVYPGDHIYAEIEVVDKRESKSKPDRGIVFLRTTVKNHDEVTVAIWNISFMWKRKPQ